VCVCVQSKERMRRALLETGEMGKGWHDHKENPPQCVVSQSSKSNTVPFVFAV